MKKRLLRRILCDFINERKLLPLDCVELFLQRHSRGFSARFVFLAPSLKGPIPNEAGDTAGAPQVDLLLWSRVQAYFVAERGRQSPVYIIDSGHFRVNVRKKSRKAPEYKNLLKMKIYSHISSDY